MSYSLKIEFDHNVSEEAVNEWISGAAHSLPGDEHAFTVKMDEEIFNAEQLTDEEIGKHVRFAIPNGGEVQGTLDTIFPVGNPDSHARVLVVDGLAHMITYGLVRVS